MQYIPIPPERQFNVRWGRTVKAELCALVTFFEVFLCCAMNGP